MKKILVVVTLLSMLCMNALADGLWSEATESYASGDYSRAIALYIQIAETEGASDDLYYNMGNAYYKLNDNANSIINYRRSLKLNPRNADAKFNLKMAQARVKDNIEAEEMFFLKSWASSLTDLQRSDAWLIEAAVFFIMSLLGLLVFLFAATPSRRRTGFYSSIVCALLFIVSLTCSISKYHAETSTDQAVIVAGSVTLKSSPDQSGTDLFILHAGAEVSVKERVGDWVNIRLANGDMGWMPEKDLERI